MKKTVYRKRFAVEELLLEYQKVAKQRDEYEKLLQWVYDEHMHFGWGYEELHDKIIEALGDKLVQYRKPIEASNLSSVATTTAPRETP